MPYLVFSILVEILQCCKHTHTRRQRPSYTDTENKEEVSNCTMHLWLVRLGHAHSEHIGVTSAHNRVRDKSTEVCVCVCVCMSVLLSPMQEEKV